MSDVKQVKVDNWGIYFLQRLKHFFNRTDYCDLTLQFQDNAQLKVHRLVLNACTEYFELLERTCEMYEDCLVMPDDLQADVVVPIVNFMYTGHLEFKMDILERLYQTSQILNMPVLSKLLESHRNLAPKPPAHSYSGVKRFTKQSEPKPTKVSTVAGPSQKRSYSKAFDNNVVYRDKKTYQSVTKSDNINNSLYRPPSPISAEPLTSQKVILGDPRPTRYEIPEELDTDNVFDNSFCNLSYTSQPLMVHPDTVKRYKAKRSTVYGDPTGSRNISGMSTVDIVECKRITSKDENLFDDSNSGHNFSDENELFNPSYIENEKDSNQLFDQILDPNDGNGPKVTIETKDSKAASNLDHARIISEVLKKYPHLVKGNKNIKLKILDPVPGKGKKQQKISTAPAYVEDKSMKLKSEEDDFTYETDVIDSKQAAKLIALGAENTKGPWICLICGTPGKALHFNSYYKFRRHLVDVHHEKPVSNICEYCGLRSLKRNYLMHHLYAQHGVQPPLQYHFPKCNLCSYIALTEGLLVKHKLSHKDYKNFRCNVCYAAFVSSNQLLIHIQNTGHKYSAEKKSNLQCIYCLKVFLRETNLYAHIKTHHKKEAKTDCIIEDSDEEIPEQERPRNKGSIKYEPSTSFDNEYDEDLQYIQQRPLGDKQGAARKPRNVIASKQKILNPGFGTPKPAQKAKSSKNINHNDFFQDIKVPIGSISNHQEEEIVVIDNNEYVMQDNQLIPRKRKIGNRDYIIADMVEPETLQTIPQPTTSVEYTNVQNTNNEANVQQQSSMIIKKSANLNQPIQIVVSNEEEYKALMASNHPIIFDNGDSNKTLTVISAPHHDTAIETTAIDLDNTPSNEMMILPHDYPLNVTEAVTSENSNIVVVYSHPVDNQNKQFQILTTGGIGAQFVQTSAILTQNYETITTSTPSMNAHCIESQVAQTWQSMDGQQIQLPPHTVIENVVDSSEIIIKPMHSETDNNLGELPEVHLVSDPQKALSPDETDMTVNQSNVTIEDMNQNVQHEIVADPRIGVNLIEKGTITITADETMQTLSHDKSMPDINQQMEIENVLEQPIETENVMGQPMEAENVMVPMVTENALGETIETENIIGQQVETENLIEQPMMTENVLEQPMETENVLEQPMETENVIEQPMETENVIEQPIGTETEQPLITANEMEHPENMVSMTVQPTNIENELKPIKSEIALEQPVELDNLIEQPAELENVMVQAEERENMMDQAEERETFIEQPTEMECLTEQPPSTKNKISSVQENVDSGTSEYSEVEKNEILPVKGNQDTELMESQAYDDIVDINRVDDVEPIYAKVAEAKIQNLTSEWSEDEYDVAEDHCNTVHANAQNQMPEVEESIENIQQEMKKHMSAPLEADGETEESAISSQEEDSLSQEPLLAGPSVVQNPQQAQQKISSLLNDWEDNDIQEEMIGDSENVAPKTEDLATDTNNISPENSAVVPKNDKIKSLVSDWDDDDEENKE